MKKAIPLIIIFSIACIIAISLAFREDMHPPDSIFINDAVRTAMESDTPYESVYILSDRLIQAFESMDAERYSRNRDLQVFLYNAVLIFALVGILLCLYFQQKFIMPFRKLQNFAHRIATGNLDIPLEMDKHNLFGAFTESFDLMREELRLAKESEYKANQSKKELVATLSHDIKTPIASIMSAMDVMLLKSKDEKEKKAIKSVNMKLEQVNTLVTNMFHATLEELQALNVTAYEIQSFEIPPLIQNADYEKRVMPFSIPNCIILADPLRLQQVLDNIIHNSYKYANTDIAIKSYIDGNYLVVEVQDFGPGVLDEEILLLCNKYYRGKNVKNSDGYGLGLYISKYLIQQMSGELSGANYTDGFSVTISLKLAGQDEIPLA